MIFSSCYLDQIEGDAESEDSIKPVPSNDRSKYFTSCHGCVTRHVTSLNGDYFIEYMNQIGWPQGGMFSTLLSTVGYDFHEENGFMVSKAREYKVADALTLLIFELYVPFTIVIISSESTNKNIDCPSIS